MDGCPTTPYREIPNILPISRTFLFPFLSLLSLIDPHSFDSVPGKPYSLITIQSEWVLLNEESTRITERVCTGGRNDQESKDESGREGARRRRGLGSRVLEWWVYEFEVVESGTRENHDQDGGNGENTFTFKIVRNYKSFPHTSIDQE